MIEVMKSFSGAESLAEIKSLIIFYSKMFRQAQHDNAIKILSTVKTVSIRNVMLRFSKHY